VNGERNPIALIAIMARFEAHWKGDEIVVEDGVQQCLILGAVSVGLCTRSSAVARAALAAPNCADIGPDLLDLFIREHAPPGRHPVLPVQYRIDKASVLIGLEPSQVERQPIGIVLQFLAVAVGTIILAFAGRIRSPARRQSRAGSTVGLNGRLTGEAVLEHANALSCNLLIKGAYTQSRLRQFIFGGTTQYILSNATLPVLMAH
jgi:nucleotide-binding universal stress UspA family protein